MRRKKNALSQRKLVKGSELGWVSKATRNLKTKRGTNDNRLIGRFRVSPGLCFKTRVGAKPLIWKSFFILMQIKLIFTRKVVHLEPHFEGEGFWSSEVAYWSNFKTQPEILDSQRLDPRAHKFRFGSQVKAPYHILNSLSTADFMRI